MPPVSICIPTYNYARYIGQAIESVLGQTHEDIELLVIDDRSSDETAAVVGRYEDDPRLRFHVNAENLGLFGNFNRCLEWAQHDYVKVLCADDWLHPRSIEDALAVLEAHPSAGMATSPGWLVTPESGVIGIFSAPFGAGPVVPGRTAIEVHADWGNRAGMPSHVLLRRDVALAAGGFQVAFEPASDLHLWLKILARHDLGWVPEPRCYLRVHTAKSHDYGHVPTEGVFRSWEDMAVREPAVVDRAMLERALYGEAREHLVYVGSHLLRLRIGRACRLLAAIARHVPLRRVVPRFARELPALLRAQARRIRALRRGRLVIYDPLPRIGPPRQT